MTAPGRDTPLIAELISWETRYRVTGDVQSHIVTITLGAWACDCRDYENRRRVCEHAKAVRALLLASGVGTPRVDVDILRGATIPLAGGPGTAAERPRAKPRDEGDSSSPKPRDGFSSGGDAGHGKTP